MRSFLAAILFLAVVACSKDKVPAPGAPTSVTPAQVALADFAHLSYLEGSWRGQPASGAPFYERYARLDDSTITSYTFSDSTFQAASDSGQIGWRAGEVRTGSSPRGWVATVWSVDSVRFESEHGGNSFVWIRKSADAWEARLSSPQAASATVYQMTRVAP